MSNPQAFTPPLPHHEEESSFSTMAHEKYYRKNPDTGCWDFTRKTQWNGYGRVCIESKRYMAHRFFYEKEHGKIDPALVLDHLCSNRSCVNPSHLEAVPQRINARRGRATKLNSGQVHDIRRLYAQGKTQTAISKQFGVGQDAISRIVRHESWKVV